LNEPACIRIWTRDSIPEPFRHLIPSVEDTGIFAIFVAHVPAAVLTEPTYRLCNGESAIAGWIREGESGLFGSNAMNTYPHPDGDGILIVGSCV
jgi:hypothetical protein